MRTAPARHVAVILVSALVASCGGSSTPTAPTTPQLAPIADLVLSESALSVARHSLTQVTATLRRTDGSTEDVTRTATWASSNPEIASVQQGLVVGVGNGTATVSAGCGGVIRSIDVVVRRDTVLEGEVYLRVSTGVRNVTQVVERVVVSIDGVDAGTCVPGGGFASCTALFGRTWPSEGRIGPGSHEVFVRIVPGPSPAGGVATVSGSLSVLDGDSGMLLQSRLLTSQRGSLPGTTSFTWQFEVAVWP